MLRPDQTRDGKFAYGYIEPGCEIQKWCAVTGHCHSDPEGYLGRTAVQAMTQLTLHINVYKNMDGLWETAAHETIDAANRHAGPACWAQTAITVMVPEE